MFPENFEAFGRTLLHTILSTNNIYLWANNREYFSENSDLIPLLHTWSLSVEEQFYFIWPSLLLLLFKVKQIKKKAIIVALFLIIGLAISVYLTYSDLNTAYFLLHGRIFELGIGAALAIFWHSLPTTSKITNTIISILGFCLLFIPAFILDKNSLFPGFNALWPCLGTAMLIFSNKENNENGGIVNTILKNKYIVFIGLISYSMYLWHWPIFVFIKFYGIELTGLIRIASLLVITLLSYLSWKFIEQPFRTTLKFDFKKTMLFIMLPAVAIFGIIYAVVDANDGFPNRFPKLAEFNPKLNYPNKVRNKCFDKYIIGNCDECFLGVKKDTLDGVLIGDSFANHTASFLDVLAKDANLYIHDSAAGGYALLADVDENNNTNFDPQYGIDRLNYAKQFKTIYIASNWNLLTLSKSNRERIMETIAELIKKNKKIVIFDCLRPITEMKLHKLKLAKAYPDYFDEEVTFDEVNREENYLVFEIKHKFPSVLVIDMNEGVRENGKLTTKLENTIIYRTFDHLNTSGAKLIGEKYLLKNGNPLKELK